MRWDPYILAGAGEFELFWRDHLRCRPRKTLFLLGRGFDPRALKAIRKVHGLGVLPRVWLLAFEDGQEDSPRRRELTSGNRSALADLVGEENIVELPVTIGMAGHPNATSRSTRSAISRPGPTTAFDDVVIDISAMPRIVALSAIAKLIHDQDAAGRPRAVRICTWLRLRVSDGLGCKGKSDGRGHESRRFFRAFERGEHRACAASLVSSSG